jgi:hypothetical protein
MKTSIETPLNAETSFYFAKKQLLILAFWWKKDLIQLPTLSINHIDHYFCKISMFLASRIFMQHSASRSLVFNHYGILRKSAILWFDLFSISLITKNHDMFCLRNNEGTNLEFTKYAGNIQSKAPNPTQNLQKSFESSSAPRQKALIGRQN